MRGKSRFRQTKFIKPRYRNRHQVDSIITQRYNEIQEETENEEFKCDAQINDEKPVKELLRSWASCHGITTRAVNDLLRILITAGLYTIHLFERVYFQ